MQASGWARRAYATHPKQGAPPTKTLEIRGLACSEAPSREQRVHDGLRLGAKAGPDRGTG
jgi:hypothetical protein